MEALDGLLPGDALLARRTTPDQVADVLREAILTGRLEDGAELNQVSLAEHFGISRVPIREALRQLHAEGLIRQEAHRRAVVSTLSIEHIEELFDLRVLHEVYLLNRAFELVDASTIAELRATLATMARLGSEDHELWLAENRRFHDGIYRCSGATFTIDLTAGIAARTTRYLYLKSGGMGLKRQNRAHREHEVIVEAIVEGDRERAVHELEVHINGTRQAVLQFLKGRSETAVRGTDGAGVPALTS